MSSNGHRDNGHAYEDLTAAFGTESAAKVTGFSTRQLARWDREGWYSPAYGDPDRREVFGRIYSYADLVRLRTARALLDRGVPVRRALESVAALRTPDWQAVPSTPLYVTGRDVAVSRRDAQAKGGEVSSIEPATVLADVDDGIRRLGVRTPEQIGATERRRGWVDGEEVFAGTRIPVTTVTSLIEDGWTRAELLEGYPRLRDADVDLAEARVRRAGAVAS